MEPVSDAPSPCQITPALIEKDRFRTCPCFASLDSLLITLPTYYFRVQLKKFDRMEKLPIDLEALVGQAFEQIQKLMTCIELLILL